MSYAIKTSSLCERGWQRLLLTGTFRDILIRHFGDQSQIESDDLKNYIWRPGDDTGISIESHYVWRKALAQKRPAVLLKDQEQKVVRIALNDLSGQTGDGTQTHSVMMVGGHTVFCLQRSGAATEILAAEVYRQLGQFAPVIRKQLGLHRFELLKVGAVTELDESSEHFAVAIDFGWTYEMSWDLVPEDLPLRRFDFSVVLKD